MHDYPIFCQNTLYNSQLYKLKKHLIIEHLNEQGK